jgi:hypothetical protein
MTSGVSTGIEYNLGEKPYLAQRLGGEEEYHLGASEEGEREDV